MDDKLGMPYVTKDFKNGHRPHGNLLPHPLPAEKAGECKRYFIDPEKYAEGAFEPISEPEAYEQPEITLDTMREIPCENIDLINARREQFLKYKTKKDRPSKEDLSADMKIMTNLEIAEKYNVSKSLVENWIRAYGIQRRKGALITMGDIEPEKPIEPTTTPEVIVDPSPEQVEQFYTDVTQKSQPSDELTTEEKEKLVELGYTEFAKEQTDDELDFNFTEIWSDVKDDLVVLRAMYIRKAGRDFDRKLNELIKAVSGGDKAC